MAELTDEQKAEANFKRLVNEVLDERQAAADAAEAAALEEEAKKRTKERPTFLQSFLGMSPPRD